MSVKREFMWDRCGFDYWLCLLLFFYLWNQDVLWRCLNLYLLFTDCFSVFWEFDRAHGFLMLWRHDTSAGCGVSDIRSMAQGVKLTMLHQNLMSYGQTKPSAVKSMSDSEFPCIWGSTCLVNASRVHTGPVNGSSNTMKQLLRRGRSAYLNRNVTK